MHEGFMAKVIAMTAQRLAAQRHALIDTYPGADTPDRINTLSRQINFVDAVGHLKFGHEWPDIRDA